MNYNFSQDAKQAATELLKTIHRTTLPGVSDLLTLWGLEGSSTFVKYCENVDYYVDIEPRIAKGELVGYDAQVQPVSDVAHLVKACTPVDDESLQFILDHLPQIIQTNTPEDDSSWREFRPLASVDLGRIARFHQHIREESDEHKKARGIENLLTVPIDKIHRLSLFSESQRVFGNFRCDKQIAAKDDPVDIYDPSQGELYNKVYYAFARNLNKMALVNHQYYDFFFNAGCIAHTYGEYVLDELLDTMGALEERSEIYAGEFFENAVDSLRLNDNHNIEKNISRVSRIIKFLAKDNAWAASKFFPLALYFVKYSETDPIEFFSRQKISARPLAHIINDYTTLISKMPEKERESYFTAIGTFKKRYGVKEDNLFCLLRGETDKWIFEPPNKTSLGASLEKLLETYHAPEWESDFIPTNYRAPNTKEKRGGAKHILNLVRAIYTKKIQEGDPLKIYGVSLGVLENLRISDLDISDDFKSPNYFPLLSPLRPYAGTEHAKRFFGEMHIPKEGPLAEILASSGDILGIARQLGQELRELTRTSPENIQDDIAAVVAQLHEPLNFNRIKVEFNHCPIDNVINAMDQYCIFNGNRQGTASLLHCLDPSIEMLCVNSYQGDVYVKTMAGMILIDTENDKGSPYIVVEGFLGMPKIDRVTGRVGPDKDFIPRTAYDALIAYISAKSQEKSKAYRLFFNASHGQQQQEPHEFLRYVAQRNGIAYSMQKGPNFPVFVLDESYGTIVEHDERFSQMLRKKPMPSSILEAISKKNVQGAPLYYGWQYTHTWYKYWKMRGEDIPTWSGCQGLVWGFEIDINAMKV